METSEKQLRLRTMLDTSLKNRGVKDGFSHFYAVKGTKVVQQEINIKGIHTHAHIILQEFNLQEFILLCFDLSSKLESEISQKWIQDFTKTIMLYGNPEKIISRTNIIASRTRDIAYSFPGESKQHTSLSLLLRSVYTNGKKYYGEDVSFVLPGESTGKVFFIYIDTLNLSFERYLVHVNHTIVESLISHILNSGDSVHIKHISDIPVVEKYIYHRIGINERSKDELHLYTAIEQL